MIDRKRTKKKREHRVGSAINVGNQKDLLAARERFWQRCNQTTRGTCIRSPRQRPVRL